MCLFNGHHFHTRKTSAIWKAKIKSILIFFLPETKAEKLFGVIFFLSDYKVSLAEAIMNDDFRFSSLDKKVISELWSQFWVSSSWPSSSGFFSPGLNFFYKVLSTSRLFLFSPASTTYSHLWNKAGTLLFKSGILRMSTWRSSIL